VTQEESIMSKVWFITGAGSGISATGKRLRQLPFNLA